MRLLLIMCLFLPTLAVATTPLRTRPGHHRFEVAIEFSAVQYREIFPGCQQLGTQLTSSKPSISRPFKFECDGTVQTFEITLSGGWLSSNSDPTMTWATNGLQATTKVSTQSKTKCPPLEHQNLTIYSFEEVPVATNILNITINEGSFFAVGINLTLTWDPYPNFTSMFPSKYLMRGPTADPSWAIQFTSILPVVDQPWNAMWNGSFSLNTPCHIAPQSEYNLTCSILNFTEYGLLEPSVLVGAFQGHNWAFVFPQPLIFYDIPTFHQISPNRVGPAGGLPITIKGEGFLTDSTIIFLKIGAQQVQGKTVNNSTLQFIAPPFKNFGDVTFQVFVSFNEAHFVSTNLFLTYYPIPQPLTPHPPIPQPPTPTPETPTPETPNPSTPTPSTPTPSPPKTPLTPVTPAQSSPPWFEQNIWIVFVGATVLLLIIIIILSISLFSKKGCVLPCGLSPEDEQYAKLQSVVEEIGLTQKAVIKANEVELMGLVGRGSFADVYEGKWKHAKVAVKKLRNFDDRGPIQELISEAKIMVQLRHPNVVSFMGICCTENDLCIVSEYVERGSLSSLLMKGSWKFEDEHRRKIALDVCFGIGYLHEMNLMHRDLKSKNLLVSQGWVVKVADFGLSKFVEENRHEHTLTACGTPSFSAPEVLDQQKYTFSADIYSLGMVLFEIWTQSSPFHNVLPYQIMVDVVQNRKKPTAPESCDVPEAITELINNCLSYNPTDRPRTSTIINILTDLVFLPPNTPYPQPISSPHSSQGSSFFQKPSVAASK